MSEIYKILDIQDLEGELWKDIPEYEDLYRVSNLGRIKSLPTVGVCHYTVILKQYKNEFGYLIVNLYKNRVDKHVRVHRAVALAFIKNPLNKRTVNHDNKIKTDNRLTNLHWATHSEQHLHAYKNGRKNAHLGKIGNLSKSSKKVFQLDKSGNIMREFAGALEAERELGVCSRHISSVCRGKRISTGGFKWQFA